MVLGSEFKSLNSNPDQGEGISWFLGSRITAPELRPQAWMGRDRAPRTTNTMISVGSLLACIYIYVYTHVYIYLYMCADVYIYIHIFMCIRSTT